MHGKYCSYIAIPSGKPYLLLHNISHTSISSYIEQSPTKCSLLKNSCDLH